MVQPFKHSRRYGSDIWPELMIEKKRDHLLFEFSSTLETFSSAVLGGGYHKASHFINWQVPLDYVSSDPINQLQLQLHTWHYPTERSIGLLTAAKIEQASIQEIVGDQFRLVCCVTAGIGNKARAGRVRTTFPAYQPGTINAFIFIDGRLSHSAMINSIITATEAKAAALQDLKIIDEDGELATGTTTDSVVIAASQCTTYPIHLFAGTATSLGNEIGICIYDAICEIVQGQDQD